MRAAVVFGSLGLAVAQCAVRKEIRELSPEEREIYFEAVRMLHQTPKDDGSGQTAFEWFTEVHMANKGAIHGSPLFLPWHRHFIHLYEQELRRMDSRVVLPYWDWSLDNAEPHRSFVLGLVGGNGDRRSDYCVTRGPFAGWQVRHPTPHCLRRSYDLDRRISPFATTESIAIDCNEPRFSDFSLRFEIKHGNPHVSIGGTYGDFSTMNSPNDPIFYLHHAFVDLVWAEWQLRNPAAPFEGERYNQQADESTLLPFFNVTVRETLDTAAYCYGYDRFPRIIRNENTPPAVQSSIDRASRDNPFLGRFRRRRLDSLLNLPPREFPRARLDLPGLVAFKQRKRTPLPESFVHTNNLNLTYVRTLERQDAQLVDLLNSLAYSPMAYTQSIIDSFTRR